MNSEEHKKHLEEITALTTEILKSEKKTRDFLVRAGILTPEGELTEQYTLPEEYKTKENCTPKEAA